MLAQTAPQVLSHLITLLGACYVARRAHATVQLGKAAFSGKPVVHMTIVQDPANPENFEVREAAYRQFLSKCGPKRLCSP